MLLLQWIIGTVLRLHLLGLRCPPWWVHPSLPHSPDELSATGSWTSPVWLREACPLLSGYTGVRRVGGGSSYRDSTTMGPRLRGLLISKRIFAMSPADMASPAVRDILCNICEQDPAPAPPGFRTVTARCEVLRCWRSRGDSRVLKLEEGFLVLSSQSAHRQPLQPHGTRVGVPWLCRCTLVPPLKWPVPFFQLVNPSLFLKILIQTHTLCL